MDPEREQEQATGERRPRTPQPAQAAPVDERVELAATMGNQAFTALARSGAEAPRGVESSVARALVARNGNEGQQGAPGATATPGASPTDPAPAPWVAPFGLGNASTHAEAAIRLIQMEDRAQDLIRAGYTWQIEDLLPELRSRYRQLANNPEAPLSIWERGQLQNFSEEFAPAHDLLLGQMRDDIIRQIRMWEAPPLTEDQLFELREAVHNQFLSGDESRIGQLAEYLEKLEELTGKINDWTEYAGELQGFIRGANSLERMQEIVGGVHDRVERVTEIVSLANNLGRLAGILGEGPAGEDPIARVEGALGVMDFIIGRANIPGFTQLWDGYILEAARAALAGLRHVLNTFYQTERGANIRVFFMQNRNRATAPPIEGGMGSRIANLDRHFPGGQPVLDFMWLLMRGEEPSSVPATVEDYFVRYRSEFNAGMGGSGNEIETDSSWTNAWNLFTRTESPNLLRWVRDNRQEVWTRLYGGMPPPN